ncbi:MAG: glycosyltransferase [Anaerolineales bacterium]
MITEVPVGGTRQPTVSVVIPTINEAKNLPHVLTLIPDWIHEVLLVDGLSSDNTVEVARQLKPDIRIVMQDGQGKGNALRCGFEAATGDIIVMLDADGSTDPVEISSYVGVLLSGADFAKGSRFLQGGGTADMEWYRRMGNWGFVLLSRLLFGCQYTDLCYGYNAFWKRVLPQLDLDADGFEIETMMNLRVLHAGLKVAEVPSFEDRRLFGTSNLKTIPDGWRVLKTIFYEWIKGKRKKDRKVSNAGEVHPSVVGGMLAYEDKQPLSQPFGIHAMTQQPVRAADLPNFDPLGSAQGGVRYLSMIGLILAAGLNLRDILQRTLQLALQSVDASSGSIMLLNENGHVSEVCLIYEGEVRSLSAVQVADTLKEGLAGWVVQNRQAALVENTCDDPRWLRRAWDENDCNSRSAISIPLIATGRVAGVMTLVGCQGNQFTDKDLEVLTSTPIYG